MELTPKQNFTIDQDTTLPPYEGVNRDVLTGKVDYNDAFYGAALMGSEDPLETYLGLIDEMETMGDSAVLHTLRSQYQTFASQEQASFVENLVADESIDRATKRAVLEKQLKFNKPENVSLRSQYLEGIANAQMATMPEFSDNVANDLKFKIHGLKTKQDFTKMLEDLSGMIQGTTPIPELTDQEFKESGSLLDAIGEKVWDPIIAEPAALFQTLVIGLAPYIGELIGTGYIAATDGKDTNITEAREEARKVVAEHGGDWLIETYQDFIKFFGIEKEDLEEAYVTKAFTKLDEGLTWAAKKITPDDVDKSKIILEILTAAAVPILRKGKFYVKGQYLKATDPVAYEIYTNKNVKKPIDPYQDDANTRTIEDLGITVPKDSPLDATIHANKEMTKNIVEGIMTDEGNTAFRATKYTPESFVAQFMMPGIVRKPMFNEHYDATPQFKQLKLVQEETAREIVFNPFLVDKSTRYSWVQENVNVLNETLTDIGIEMSPAQSTFHPSGLGIKSELVFNKDGFNYDSYFEANEAAKALEGKLDKIKTEQDIGKVMVEALDAEGDVIGTFDVLKQDGPSDFLNQPQAQSSGNFRVKWTREGDFFDEVKQAAGDFNQRPWESSTALSAIFDSAAWNWIAAFGKSGKNLERRWTLSHQRAERIAKAQLDILGETLKLSNKKFRQDLHTLYTESRNKSDLFTVNEIYKILDYNPTIEHVRSLQDSLALTRQIDRFNYKVLNLSEINKALEKGYKDYLDITKDDGSKSRSMVKQEFLFDPDKQIRQIWDPENNTAIEFNKHQANTNQVPIKQYLYENDKPTRQIVELEKTFVDNNGKRYDYAVVPKTHKFTGAPDWIVPTKTGHLPRIAEGNFFVRVFPRIVEHNGIRKIAEVGKASDQHGQYGKSIAMFRTQTEANKWIEANKDRIPELKDKNSEYIVDKADELKRLDDNLETNLIREAIARPAKSSNENMYNTIYADPLESFILTSQRLGTDAYMQPVIQQMQRQWFESYKDKVNIAKNDARENPYPVSREQISAKAGRERDYRQALAEWDRMDAMQAGHGGQVLSKYLSLLGDTIGNATDSPMMLPLSKLARKLERNPQLVLDYPRRLVTTFKITLAAIWRNLTLQPIGIFGPLLVGPNSKRAMVNTAATIHYRVMQNRTFGKYDRYNKEIFNYAYEQGNITKSMQVDKKGMLSQKDHMLILKEMQDSGYGVVGDHMLAKGLFSSSVESLSGTSTFSRYAGKAIRGYGKVGFELGEFMNRAGMWHAARELWVENNPGKNWRSREALNQITFDAYQLSGSMNKQNTYAFQRVPILQYIGQFQAFGMKASESLWNKGASPYSPKQRAALMAYNLGVFGVRGGIMYGLGELLMDYLNNTGNSDIAKNLDEMALTRLVINNMADVIFPTYDQNGDLVESTADIAAVYGPFGTEAGGVYRSFWKAMVVLAGGDVPNYQLGPVTQTVVQGIDTYKLIKSMFGDDRATLDEKLGKSLIQLARLSSGGNSIWNTYMYTQMNEKISKTGQTTGVPESNFDRYARLFSVPNDKDRELFEAWRGITDEEKKYKDLAEVWWRTQLTLHGNELSFGEITEAFRAANNLMELTDNQKDIFWEHLITLDNRRVNSRFDSFFKDILNRRRISLNPKYSTEEIQAMRVFVDQAENTELKRNIEAIVNQLEEMKED